MQGNLFKDQNNIKHTILILTFKNYEESEEVTHEQRQPSCHIAEPELLVNGNQCKAPGQHSNVTRCVRHL